MVIIAVINGGYTMNNYELGQIKKLIGYEPNTGRLYWKCGHGFKAAGSPCGGTYKGRVSVHIGGARLRGEAVAWFLDTGVWPSKAVTFKDGNRLNLRRDNLCLDPRKQIDAGARGLLEIKRIGDRFEVVDALSYPPVRYEADNVDALLLALVTSLSK